MGKIIFYDLIDFGLQNHIARLIKNSFWSTENYIKVLISSVDCMPPKQHTGVPDLSEIRRWLENTIQGEVIIKLTENANKILVYAYFEIEDDAIHFQLTWGGNI
jgi:hypothetical protein